MGQAGFEGARFHSGLTFEGINDGSLVLLDGTYVRLDVPDQVKNGRHWPNGKTQSSQATVPDGSSEHGDWGLVVNSDSVTAGE